MATSTKKRPAAKAATKKKVAKKVAKKTARKPAPAKKAAGTSRKPKTAPAASPAGGSRTAASITNYTTAMKWLYEHLDYERMRIVHYNERTFSLDRMRKLLDLLGNPHAEIKTVQVAGTKGKGSTCTMLASMLEACNYTVGLYTSPHLIDLRERIRINGQIISYNDAAMVFKQIAAVEKHFGDAPLTFFEILTAAAFKHFAEQAVDVAVLETGLGGRLDCTTVCQPQVTGMTRISLDHTHILGDTMEAIAREKAGIFKAGVPAISVEQEPQVAAVLREQAEKAGTTLAFTGQEIDFSYRFEANRELGPHTRVCLSTPTSRFEHFPVPLPGEHQAHNCGLALAMLDALRGPGFQFTDEKVIAGLAATTIEGRMEQVWSSPRVMIDGAHNAASIQALIRAMGAHINYDSLVMIFGCAQDKDVLAMLRQVSLGADKVIFTKSKSNPRAMLPSDLLSLFGELSGKMAQTAETLEDALKLAGRACSREDLIMVTGSFYLAGEARKYFQDLATRQQRNAS